MKNGSKNLKIALAHDFLVQFGGAERVLEVFHEMFPEAPIYTLLYDEEKMGDKFKRADIRTSSLQKFPKILRKRYRWLLPFMPSSVESMDFREFDLVISSSSAWSKGIVTRLSTKHIAYLHSPMRFVWDYRENYLKDIRKKGLCLRLFLSYLRIWDRQAADRPEFLISNSVYTKKRVKKYYRKESSVIYPPVYNNFKLEIKSVEPRKKGYFLIVSRLFPYKKIDKVIKAFNELNLPLKIAGIGRQEKYLRHIANSNIEILGWQKEEELESLYRGARAFIFSALDDFGLAPVEAMSFGIPVIAFKKGGSLEYVKEGKTGEFFNEQKPEAIKKSVEEFIKKENQYNREYIKKQVQKFSKARFKEEIENFIEENVLNINND